MQIRPYQPTDLDPLLAVFRKSVPHAFAESEINEYTDFLRTNTDPYFVAEQNGQLLGACGYYLTQNGHTARICWIFKDPDCKGLGVGGTLLSYTLEQVRQQLNIERVDCRTSQVALQFFEKFGFQLQYTERDYWAPGLDLYFMTLSINTL